MILKIRPRLPIGSAVEIKGRQLAPMINIFDNLDEIELVLAAAGIFSEEMTVDGRTGTIHFGKGSAKIGDWLVEELGNISIYPSLDAVRDKFDVIV